MNFVVLIYDTLRYDYVGCNGRRPIQTPNWDTFANSAWNFSRCYTGSYPSLPHRCDCATGKFVFPFFGWQDLPENEVVLSQKLTDAGYRTHIISDESMFIKRGPGRAFESHDLMNPFVMPDEEEISKTPLPCAFHKLRNPQKSRERWFIHKKLMENGDEKEWQQARVMRKAVEWISSQAKEKQPFFLWLESWRIHEPWIEPPQYVEMYDPGYKGEKVIGPSHSTTLDYLSPEELNHIRAMYSASVTFSDKWFGHLLETMEQNGLMDNTLFILSSDHGWSLGDHNRTGKHGIKIPPQGPWPLYEECAHVPLLVHVPGQTRAERNGELVQHADILPTLLDFAGIDPGPTAKGVSWAPVLKGKEHHTRDIAVTCCGMQEFPHSGDRITITSKDYSLILPTDIHEAELYNLALDPGQTNNIYRRHRDIANDLFNAFHRFLKYVGTDEDKRKTWEGILDDPRESM